MKKGVFKRFVAMLLIFAMMVPSGIVFGEETIVEQYELRVVLKAEDMTDFQEVADVRIFEAASEEEVAVVNDVEGELTVTLNEGSYYIEASHLDYYGGTTYDLTQNESVNIILAEETEEELLVGENLEEPSEEGTSEDILIVFNVYHGDLELESFGAFRTSESSGRITDAYRENHQYIIAAGDDGLYSILFDSEDLKGHSKLIEYEIINQEVYINGVVETSYDVQISEGVKLVSVVDEDDNPLVSGDFFLEVFSDSEDDYQFWLELDSEYQAYISPDQLEPGIYGMWIYDFDEFYESEYLTFEIDGNHNIIVESDMIHIYEPDEPLIQFNVFNEADKVYDFSTSISHKSSGDITSEYSSDNQYYISGEDGSYSIIFTCYDIMGHSAVIDFEIINQEVYIDGEIVTSFDVQISQGVKLISLVDEDGNPLVSGDFGLEIFNDADHDYLFDVEFDFDYQAYISPDQLEPGTYGMQVYDHFGVMTSEYLTFEIDASHNLSVASDLIHVYEGDGDGEPPVEEEYVAIFHSGIPVIDMAYQFEALLYGGTSSSASNGDVYLKNISDGQYGFMMTAFDENFKGHSFPLLLEASNNEVYMDGILIDELMVPMFPGLPFTKVLLPDGRLAQKEEIRLEIYRGFGEEEVWSGTTYTHSDGYVYLAPMAFGPGNYSIVAKSPYDRDDLLDSETMLFTIDESGAFVKDFDTIQLNDLEISFSFEVVYQDETFGQVVVVYAYIAIYNFETDAFDVLPLMQAESYLLSAPDGHYYVGAMLSPDQAIPGFTDSEMFELTKSGGQFSVSTMVLPLLSYEEAARAILTVVDPDGEPVDIQDFDIEGLEYEAGVEDNKLYILYLEEGQGNIVIENTMYLDASVAFESDGDAVVLLIDNDTVVMTPYINKDALIALIDVVDNLNLSGCTEASKQAADLALTLAKAVADNTLATDEEVEGAIQALQLSYESLVVKEPVITITPSDVTNGPVVVTIDGAYDLVFSQTKEDTPGVFESYTGPFEVYENTTVYAKQIFESLESDVTKKSITNIDQEGPVVEVLYSTTEMTNENVTVTLVFDEQLVMVQGDFVTVFTENGSKEIIVEDLAGNRLTLTVTVNNIDKDAPVGTVTYSTEALTNGSVTATLTTNEDVTMVEACPRTFNFTENGEEEFVFEDAAGNIGRVLAKVTNIDTVSPVGTVTYSTTETTNGSVIATLITNEPVNMVDACLSEVEFTENGTYDFVFEDLAGNGGSIRASVKNIDKDPPVVEVLYSTTEMTNENVTATLVFDEQLVMVQGDFVTVFTDNGSKEIIVEDLAGNRLTLTVTVNNIDKDAPVGTVTYSTEALTNGSVTATLTTNEDVTMVEACPRTFNFTENGEEEFVFEDAAGNIGRVLAKVTNIDTVSPVGTVTYSTTETTNGSVIARLITNEPVNMVDACLSEVEFTENGTYDFVFEDLAGNGGSIRASVKNIDKDPPVVEVLYSTTEMTNENVTATLVFDEQLVMVQGDFVTVFTENGSKEIIVEDLAGNRLTLTVTVSNIDRVAPVVEALYSTTEATNEDVTVTLVSDEPFNMVQGDLVTVFTENRTEEVIVEDLAGNRATLVLTVENIDREAPIGVLTYSTEDLTNGRVVVTLTTNELVTMVDDCPRIVEFTENGSFDFIFEDAAGNRGLVVANVLNIDTESPLGRVIYSTEDLTNGSVIATLETDEPVTMVGDGPMALEFVENGTTTFVFEDLAGNQGIAVARVLNIDTQAPLIEIVEDGDALIIRAYEELTNVVANYGGKEQALSLTQVGGLYEATILKSDLMGALELIVTANDQAHNEGVGRYTMTPVVAGVTIAHQVSDLAKIEGGAFDKDGTLSVRTVSVQAKDNQSFVSEPLDFTVTNDAVMTENVVLDLDLGLGLDEWTKLYYHDPSTDLWIVLDGDPLHGDSMYNPENITKDFVISGETYAVEPGHLVAVLEHFSTYAAMTDQTAPILLVDQPVAGLTSNASLEITVTVNEKSDIYDNGLLIAQGIEGSVNVPLQLSEGMNICNITAKDEAGNESMGTTFKVELDSLKPDVTISGAIDGGSYTEAITLDYDVKDAHSTTVEVTLKKDDATVDYDKGDTISALGSYTFTVKVTDLMGNVANNTMSFVLTDQVNNEDETDDSSSSNSSSSSSRSSSKGTTPAAVIEIVEEETALGLGEMSYLDGSLANFRPEEFVTRGELSQWVSKALNLSSDVKSSVFTDVSSDHVNFEAIHALYESGIIDGFPDGTFRPDEHLTRAQMAKMMNMAMGRDQIKFTMPEKFDFKDDGLNTHWAVMNIIRMVGEGLFDGYPDGYFYPENSLKRCQAVAILNRYTKEEIQSDLYTDPTFEDVSKDHWAYDQIEAAVR